MDTQKSKAGRPHGSTADAVREREIKRVLPVALKVVLHAAERGDIEASCTLVNRYGSHFA